LPLSTKGAESRIKFEFTCEEVRINWADVTDPLSTGVGSLICLDIPWKGDIIY